MGLINHSVLVAALSPELHSSELFSKMISNSPECSSSHSYSPGFEGLAGRGEKRGGRQPAIMGPFVFQRLDFNDVETALILSIFSNIVRQLHTKYRNL